ncbi:MAG: PEP-CTERM sorting domain-containing protein [Planctomycetota bacterium]
MFRSTLALAACSTLFAGGASASPITVMFGDSTTSGLFTTGGGSGVIDNTVNPSVTVDGVTLTLDTGSPTSTFESTSTGTGITSPGNASDLQVDDGENFTLSFDASGTLDEVVGFQFPGSSEVTFTNTATSESETVTFTEDDNSGQTINTEALNLSFSAGDVITVTNVVTQFGPLSQGYRFQSFTVTVPEPGSVALLGLGSALMLMRRRSA